VTPVPYIEAFDMMSRFLSAEKVKQVSLDFAGDAFLTSASQIWDDLRLSCNSIRDEHGLPREAVASWKDENGVSNMPPKAPETITTPEKSSPSVSSADSSKNKSSAKKSAKKEKKEAKKAKKSAKKAKKEAKKAKKAAKKRESHSTA